MLAVQLSNATSVFVIGQVGAGGTAWLRMCFGVVFLWIIARPNFRSIRKQDIPALIALGVVTGFMTALFLEAVDRIPLGTAVSIEFLGPLTVAGIMSKNRKALMWPILAVLGVVLLTEPWHGKIDAVGVMFALGAGTCWGLYNILTQHVGDRFSGISGLSLTIPVVAFATMPVGLPQVISHDFAWWTLPAAAGHCPHHPGHRLWFGDVGPQADDAHRFWHIAFHRTGLWHSYRLARFGPDPNLVPSLWHHYRDRGRSRGTARRAPHER